MPEPRPSTLNAAVRRTCPGCKGDGYWPASGRFWYPCLRCGATGYVRRELPGLWRYGGRNRGHKQAKLMRRADRYEFRSVPGFNPCGGGYYPTERDHRCSGLARDPEEGRQLGLLHASYQALRKVLGRAGVPRLVGGTSILDRYRARIGYWPATFEAHRAWAVGHHGGRCFAEREAAYDENTLRKQGKLDRQARLRSLGREFIGEYAWTFKKLAE